MAEFQLPKLTTRVRFPSSAPSKANLAASPVDQADVRNLHAPPARRATDRRSVGVLRSVAKWTNQWGAAGGGQLLLVVTGLITAASYSTLAHGTNAWHAYAVVSAAMVALLAVSFAVPWSRLPRPACLIFPVLVWLAIATLGLSANGVGANYLGLFTLSFLYIGLTQRVGVGAALIPLAALMYVAANAKWTVQLLPRLTIAMTVYPLVAETLAVLQSRHRDLTSRLRESAHTDALTGLPNRRDLDIRLTAAVPGDLLLLCDIDHFKLVNDRLGHAAGDRALADLGMLLRGSLRDGDYAARYGGEEFAILLGSSDVEQADTVLNRLRTRWTLLQPEITFSTGSAQCQPDRSIEATMMVADEALYAAKADGRNCDRTEAQLSRASTAG
jgi:diguanylate cyclase (GGDEF)-like protein